MEKSARGKPRDRFSELPDSIILHILSVLPITDVIKTTFLSRRWNNLWTTVPCLNFTHKYAYEDFEEEKVRNFVEKVRNFVNRALLSWKGSKILKFNLVVNYDMDSVSLDGDIGLWVRFAMDKNVEELCLDFRYSLGSEDWESSGTYTVPHCLYFCSSITKLSLLGCNFKIHGSPRWNKLKSLRICGIWFTEDLISRIMLGCPLLEDFELRLQEEDKTLNIQSTSLKRLKIDKYLYGDEVLSLHSKLRICCPNLKILELFGILYSDYQLENVSSLSDASLCTRYILIDEDEYMLTKLMDLFPDFEHVEKVTLSHWCVKVLSKSENLLRPLPNVKFIKLHVRSIKRKRLVDLLAKFPNIKMLVIEAGGEGGFAEQDYSFIDKLLKPEEGFSTSSFPQLRTVEICAKIDDPRTFQSIVFLLNHCSMLQKLVILAKEPKLKLYPSGFMFKVAGVMLSLQRSYPNTQMIFNEYRLSG